MSYIPFNWKDHIIEQDGQGNVVYERDENGNIILLRDRYGNIILDPIYNEPIPEPKVLQEGTRHSASRENHQEQGIYNAHNRLDMHDRAITRLMIQLEIDGRAPGHKGTVYDMFEGDSSNMKRQSQRAVLTKLINSGTTTLNVDNTDGFEVGQEVTVYDDENSENILITGISNNTITVQELQNTYKKGAVIARSNADIDGNMKFGVWGTYSIEAEEVI